jgi:hypothetical protein
VSSDAPALADGRLVLVVTRVFTFEEGTSMADAARIHEPESPSVAEPKPLLQVVRDTVADAASGEDMPNVGRSAVIGYVIGFVVATVAITVGGTIAGQGVGASLGLGVFVGLWGGGGFGFMMGGTVPLARHLDARSARSTHHAQGDGNGTAAR